MPKGSRLGLYLPVYGGWLRRAAEHEDPPTYDYVRRVALRAEEMGLHSLWIPDHLLNPIKGAAAPSLEAWTLAAAVAASTTNVVVAHTVRMNATLDGSGWVAYGHQGGGTGQFDYPKGIAVGGGSVYVADGNNQRIVRLSTALEGSGWFDYKPTNPWLDGIAGIAVSADRVCVTVASDVICLNASLNGSGRVAFGTQGSGIGEFYWPDGLTINGRLPLRGG